MNGAIDLQALSWPVSRLEEAIEVLAQRSGLVSRAGETSGPVGVPTLVDDYHLKQWLEASANRLGIEAESVETSYAGVEQFVRGAGPALLRLPAESPPRFLALLPGTGRRVQLLGPDLKKHHLSRSVIGAVICQPLEEPLAGEVERLLDHAGVSKRRQSRARQAILRERLSHAHIEIGWLLRQQPGAGVWQQLRYAQLPQQLLQFLAAHMFQYLIWLLSWWVIGQAALQGRLDWGALLAWGLLLFSLIPFRLITTWLQGRLAIRAGILLKQRLLAGVLNLVPEALKHQGAGQFLGRVIEAEAIETLALSGGLLGLLAGLELMIAVAILGAGAGGLLQAALLLGWLVLTGLLGWGYLKQRQGWTESRLKMTHNLIERMLGHRTRLAQEHPDHWHTGEDQELADYVIHSQQVDRATVRLLALVPRGWLVLGLFGLAPAFIAGDTTSTGLAVGLGGTLLAYQALHKLAPSLVYLTDATIAWRQVRDLFRAAVRSQPGGAPTFTLLPAARSRSAHGRDGSSLDRATVIKGHNLVFRYREHDQPILQNSDLEVRAGDRILLEGPSGSGKSTLAHILTGLGQPETGLLLLQGLDRQTLGSEAWRRRIVAAPQFHENHVVTGTFAFNLLMGRNWPPQPEDIKAAETICYELGLQDLLERMPAGLNQMVGETGWQLSHGERSRLFLARALLQEADLTILDESFAALDPISLHRALQCTLDRATTLMVIAHP